MTTVVYNLGPNGMIEFHKKFDIIKEDINAYQALTDNPLYYNNMVAAMWNAIRDTKLSSKKIPELRKKWDKEITVNKYAEDTVWEPFKIWIDKKLLPIVRDHTGNGNDVDKETANIIQRIDVLKVENTRLADTK